MRFLLLGLLVAGLEEFITQGVLKKTYAGWILPTLIAFVPFLLLTRAIGALLGRYLPESTSVLSYYMAAGTIGLMVEWFLIGLSPWRDPTAPVAAIVVFHAGMFSFWGGVALVPSILLDARESVAAIRRLVKRLVTAGFVVIYFLAFGVPQRLRFAIVIISVLVLFLSLNACYIRYLRILRCTARGSRTQPVKVLPAPVAPDVIRRLVVQAGASSANNGR